MVYLRASKIVIDMPKPESAPWIHITVQKVFKDDDGKITNLIPRFSNISKPLSELYTKLYQYQDPVTGANGDISGAGVAGGMTSVVLTLLSNEYNAEITEDGYIKL